MPIMRVKPRHATRAAARVFEILTRDVAFLARAACARSVDGIVHRRFARVPRAAAARAKFLMLALAAGRAESGTGLLRCTAILGAAGIRTAAAAASCLASRSRAATAATQGVCQRLAATYHRRSRAVRARRRTCRRRARRDTARTNRHRVGSGRVKDLSAVVSRQVMTRSPSTQFVRLAFWTSTSYAPTRILPVMSGLTVTTRR